MPMMIGMAAGTASSMLFLVCLFMEAIRVHPWTVTLGGQFLLTGWMGPLVGLFEWYANPLLFIANVKLFRSRASQAIAFSAAALALMLVTRLRGCMVADEGGRCYPILEYGAGYWLWIASCGITLVGATVVALRQRVAK